ncbi:MAG: peptidase M48 [Betaproteobacteria bacterium RIFCSPLOWO2_12_FULL_68_20]|nr:MAG: peptidase M48 [Betaproteobacteria bacterium RIFCSPLOWO2_12_FULL_68_20]
MRFLVLAIALAAATPAQAQFRLDINRLIDSARNVGRATTEFDEKGEIELGRDMAARLLGAAPLAADERLQRYVNQVGRWLASQTERADLPWRFGVLEAPQVNAFAVPGGIVFVTRGLVAGMRSEAELAGVLAHEIAHVLRKHHLAAIQKNAQASLAADALSIALSDRGSLAREKLIAFGTEMYARGLDKSDELEADRLGVVIAARAGYDAYGLPAVLQTLQAMNPEDSALALMFKTHPAPAERLESLEQKMQPTLDAYAAQPSLAERFAAEARVPK